MISQLAAFVGVAAVVIVTPGPDTALTIRNSLVGGHRGGVATAAGVAAGQATWAVFTAAGVAALLRASQPAFVAIRIVGAAYLIVLGAQALSAAVRRQPSTHYLARREDRRLSRATAFRQGLVSNLANPKMAVFFLSLLPQFAGADASFTALLGLGLVFSSMTFAWLTGYAVVVSRIGDVLRASAIRRAIEAMTGAVLVALGVRFVSEQR